MSSFSSSSPKPLKSNDRRLSLPASGILSSKKRTKYEIPLEYPTDIAVPSKNIIKSLYNNAVDDVKSHQNLLNEQNSGLLSLEEILIPAVIFTHVEAVKRVQAKAQRNLGPNVNILQNCRLALYESGERAMFHARQSRLIRQEEEAKQAAIQQEEKRQAREIRKQEKEQEREIRAQKRAVERAAERERRKRELKKKHPQNVELWREVALLQSELTKIEKEEIMWKETEANLNNRESELAIREQEAQQEEPAEPLVESNEKDDLEIQVDHAVEDITLSSLRIQQALRLVSNLVTQSNATQKELFENYTKDHQFHGYRGVNNPKALIRALAMD